MVSFVIIKDDNVVYWYCISGFLLNRNGQSTLIKKGDNIWTNLNRLYLHLKDNDTWIDKVQCHQEGIE